MNTYARGAAALLLCVFAPLAAAAEEGTPIADCVTIGDGHQILRSAGPRHFFLKDGESHYRVALKNNCDALAIASRIDIYTDDQANRLCPAGTVVKTNRENCRVGNVTAISAEEFAKHQRRRR